MTDAVIHRLAGKLWKCAFDDQLFDSVIGMGSHLIEFHGYRLCEKQQVLREAADQASEKPVRLSVCIYCQQGGRYFAIPRFPDWQADDGIIAHIDQNHLLPSGRPAPHSFLTPHSAEEIDKFMEWQRWKDEYRCLECSERFDDLESCGWHWTEEHVKHAKPEDVHRVLQTDPEQLYERFGDHFAWALVEAEAEEARSRTPNETPDDGYLIHHMPNVPRVRSRPGEFIVYVEGMLRRIREDVYEDLTPGERDDGDELVEEEWIDGRQRVAKIELRFCNIVDGYIPRVGDVKKILPNPNRSPRVPIVQMAWQNDPKDYFPCKVTKRAIYNLDGRLKNMFGLHAGVHLYVTQVGPLRYQLSVRDQQDCVRNCKILKSDGKGGYRVVFEDKEIKWETGIDVFRHQITFEEMESLHAEARHTNLSVRDAVQKVMKRDAATHALSVREVWDIVFSFRTCSLMGVWAQFRREHTCYRKIETGIDAGKYIFDPSGKFPDVRLSPRTTQEAQSALEHDEARRANTSLRIVVHWSRILGNPCRDDELKDGSAGSVQARLLGSLLSKFPEYTARMTQENVSRFPLSSTPETCFRSSVGDRTYAKRKELVPGTQPQLFLCTHGSTTEKRRDILSLIERLGFPRGSVEVFIVPRMTKKEAFFARLGL